MSFLDLLALQKAKLTGKYSAPEAQRGEQDAGEVEEEVRGDVREEVRENKRDQSGGNQRKNMTSVVKRLEPTVAAENGTIKTSAGFMLVDQSDQEEATENYEVLENNMKGKKEHCPTDCKNPLK